MEIIQTDSELLFFFVIVILVFYTVQVFYLLTASKTLRAIRPEFRQVRPGQVWLSMIPIFHLIWPFIINPKISASIRTEMEARGLDEAGEYGKSLGTIYPGLRVAGNIPTLGAIFSLAYLVIFIIWWVKLGGYRSRLMNSPGYGTELLDN